MKDRKFKLRRKIWSLHIRACWVRCKFCGYERRAKKKICWASGLSRLGSSFYLDLSVLCFRYLQIQAYNQKASILEGLGQTHDALHQLHLSLEYLPGSALCKLHEMSREDVMLFWLCIQTVGFEKGSSMYSIRNKLHILNKLDLILNLIFGWEWIAHFALRYFVLFLAYKLLRNRIAISHSFVTKRSFLES